MRDESCDGRVAGVRLRVMEADSGERGQNHENHHNRRSRGAMPPQYGQNLIGLA